SDASSGTSRGQVGITQVNPTWIGTTTIAVAYPTSRATRGVRQRSRAPVVPAVLGSGCQPSVRLAARRSAASPTAATTIARYPPTANPSDGSGARRPTPAPASRPPARAIADRTRSRGTGPSGLDAPGDAGAGATAG